MAYPMNRRLARTRPRVIRGAGGGEEQKSHTPVEAPDSLRSIAYANILDLLSEGEIEGFVTEVQTGVAADVLKDIYLDQTPIANADGTLNFKNVQVDTRVGTQTQDYIPGFPSVENEIAINTVLTSSSPWVRAVSNLTLSAVRLRLSVNALSKSNSTTGDISGYTINYAIDVSTDGGAYEEVLNNNFNGKCGDVYERSHRIDLPPATVSGWNIRVRRLTANAGSIYIQDTTNVVSITEIIDVKMRYPNSALSGIRIDASQFQNIPTRSYHIRGRRVKIPANYNPITRQYATTGTGTSGGTWDGTFQTAWTNNPAWIFYDLVTHPRYGLGHLVDASLVDKWSLYGIAQYCDEYVPTMVPKRAAVTTGSVTLSASATDNSYNRTTGSFLTDGFAVGDEVNATGFNANNVGRGVIKSVTALKIILNNDHVLTTQTAAAARTLATQDPTEPRMTCNIFLQQQADAYKVLSDLASVFRGICYWSNGSIVPVADRPSDPVYTYTNANVVGGSFRYEGSGRRARHTVALVSWSDPSDFGRAKVEYIEDAAGIARYGVQQTEVIAIGCNSRWMAQRIGRWILLSERLETDTVTFTVGMDGTYAVPGQIIRVADQFKAGRRIGGRIVSGAALSVVVDAWPNVMPAIGDTLIATQPNGITVERIINSVNVGTKTIGVSVSFAVGQVPAAESVWAVESSTLKCQNFRVLSVTEASDVKGYTIIGLEHNESKFNAVDFGAPVEIPTTSVIPSNIQLPPATVTVSSAERAGSVIAALQLTAKWPAAPGATMYKIQWRKGNGNWGPKLDVHGLSADLADTVFPDTYSARVYAVNPYGLTSVGKTSNALNVSDQIKKPQSLLDLATDVATATAAANAANADIANMVSDNVLSVVEKKRVINDYTILINDQPGIDAQAVAFGITTEKTAYDTALTNLTSYLGTLTTPVAWNNLTNITNVVGTTFRSKFADAYNKEVLLLNKIYANAKNLADNAQTAANTAQTTANAAVADLSNIASDNVLSVVEKKSVINDWNAIVNEKAGIDAQATKYLIDDDKTTYDTAYSDLSTYLGTLTSPVAWNNLTNITTVVGATFRSKFAAYYQAKVVLLQHIADLVMYGPNYTFTDNLAPNPSFSSNATGVPTNTFRAVNTAICDGWLVYNSPSYLGTTECGMFYVTSADQIKFQLFGQTALAAGATRYCLAWSQFIPVQPGKTYTLGYSCNNSFNGALGAGINCYTRANVHWYDAAGAQVGSWTTVAGGAAVSLRASGSYEGNIVVPAGAYSARIDFGAVVTNTSGSSYTHPTSTMLSSGFNNVWFRKLEDLQVPGSGYQLGDQTSIPPTRTGSTGSRWNGAAITYTVPTTGTTVTFNVAAGTLQAGSVGVSYNASSANVTQARSTTVTYYLYYQDQKYTGGTKTLNVTTNAADLSNADDRIWIGDATVTVPASGTGGGGGGGMGGGCVDGAMWIDGNRQAEGIRRGDLIDVVSTDYSPSRTPKKSKYRVVKNDVRIQPCWKIRTSGGAVLRASSSTPFTLRNQKSKFITEMLGEEVLVDHWGELRWEKVTDCYPIGNRPVAHIYIDEGTYFAGEDPNNRIASHNGIKP